MSFWQLPIWCCKNSKRALTGDIYGIYGNKNFYFHFIRSWIFLFLRWKLLYCLTIHDFGESDTHLIFSCPSYKRSWFDGCAWYVVLFMIWVAKWVHRKQEDWEWPFAWLHAAEFYFYIHFLILSWSDQNGPVKTLYIFESFLEKTLGKKNTWSGALICAKILDKPSSGWSWHGFNDGKLICR